MLKGFLRSVILFKRNSAKTMKYILETYFNRKIRSVLLKIGFLAILGWLVLENRALLSNQSKISDIKGLLDVIQTPPNLFVFKFGIVYTLASAVYFLIRLPFQKIAQLKVPGLEYTIETENKTKLADETLELQLKKEEARFNILNTISTPNVSKSIIKFINKNEINMAGAITLLSGIIQAYLLSSLDIKINPSVVGVVNGVPATEFDNLNINHQLLVNEILNSDTPWAIKEGRHSIMAVRYNWDEKSPDCCILCLEADSNEWTFSKTDYLMLSAAWNIVIRSLELFSKKNCAIIVTKGQAGNQGGVSHESKI